MKSISVDEALTEFNKLNYEIKRVLNKLGDDCDNVHYEPDNLDEDFLRNQMRLYADKLDDVKRGITYLSKPVVDQGYIKHNSAGRYELPSGEYFTSGSVCEILYNDERYNEQYWVYTSIEHNGNDYYATALGRDTSINGMMVRIRR